MKTYLQRYSVKVRAKCTIDFSRKKKSFNDSAFYKPEKKIFTNPGFSTLLEAHLKERYS